MADSRRQRILIITRNLPPLVGGMERLNWHMADELAKGASVRVIGPGGAAALAPRGVPVDEIPVRPLARFLSGAQWRAVRLARRWRPDVVLAGSGLTAPLAWLSARACGAEAAVYVHGLDIVVPHRIYRHLWLPALRRMDRVIANSHATAELAQQAGVEPQRISIVHPGVTMPVLDPTARSRFRDEHGLSNRPLLLSVGRLTRRKGLREFVTDVLPLVVARRSDVLLVVVGDAPRQALYAEAQTPQSIQAAADSAGVGANIAFLGRLSDSDLHAAYQAADVHVFPVQAIANDPEGFGMVAVEAAAHGLPTVAYSTAGVVDAVAEGMSGHLIAPGGGTAFAKAVLCKLNQPLLVERVRAHAEQFVWDRFGNRMMVELLNQVC